MDSIMKKVPSENELLSGTGNEQLDQLLAGAGYGYDPTQDIFYSILDPWQRLVGYCRLYDELAALLSMIMDCEPIYFDYRGEKWLIEFWKGQYGMVTGGEIGVYSGGTDFRILGWNDTFYNCASNDDLLQMSFTLKKNGQPLFTRRDTHWWLTGFVLGEFSEPSELSMDIEITLKDNAMLAAFIQGLEAAGYPEDAFHVNGTTVSLTFDTPHNPQPFTRTPLTDWITQRKNEMLCNKYREITEPFDNFQDKVKAVEEHAPFLYDRVIRIGKSRHSFEISDALVMVAILLGIFITTHQISKRLKKER